MLLSISMGNSEASHWSHIAIDMHEDLLCCSTFPAALSSGPLRAIEQTKRLQGGLYPPSLAT